MRIIYLIDFNCPYSYIGLKRLENAVERENIKLYRTFQKILFPINNDTKYEDIEISLEHRNVKVRVFNDFKDNTNHKIIVFLHGGGWAAGCLPSYLYR